MCRRSFGEAQKERLDAVIHLARQSLRSNPRALAAFDRLVLVARSHSHLFDRRVLGAPRAKDASSFLPIHGLVGMAQRSLSWRRQPEEWVPSSRKPFLVFASLAEHLYAQWPMPLFMASAWFAPHPDGARHRTWYQRLGAGESLRRIGIPMPISRAMAHAFATAPPSSSVVAGLRFAQVVGMGGTPELAKTVAATRLGRVLADEDFWATFVRWLVDHRDEIDLASVEAFVETIHARRHEPRQGFRHDGTFGSLGIADPTFTMAGRTPVSMLALVHANDRRWHVPANEVSWEPAPIAPFAFAEPHPDGDRRWTIAELTSSAELVAEGRSMRHCVATYIGRCRRGESSIWSMRIETPLEKRPVLTIDVDPKKKKIRLVRRKANAPPSDGELAILRRWAEQVGVGMDVD